LIEKSEGLWTSVEVAEYLRVGKNAPADLVRSGAIPALRIGRRLRFEPSAVRAFAQRCAEPISASVHRLRPAAPLAKSASVRDGDLG
jgi:excisionase family DNA binding protein